ncbi:ficolin-2-like [Wyeomyia smithii]|uniref:ficolin-2-like n=1 Tax=Wyeomyia smithii TaxID=174621 RepID=UPI002467E304|nr:ficolin-2-like [Wyeomyia smithii]
MERTLNRIKQVANLITQEDISKPPDCSAVQPEGEGSSNSCTNMNMADRLAQYFKEQPVVQIKFSNGTSLVSGCDGIIDETPQPERYKVIKSCREATSSGKYVLKLDSTDEGFPVLCDTEYESGGWVVIQHRFNGIVDFYRNWDQYRQGFGEFDSEFWLGNDKIHRLTATQPREIHFLLEDWEDNSADAKFSSFQIGNETEKYILKSLGTFTGTAGDSLTRVLNSKFTTMDQDNDNSTSNCAVTYHGAWWYSNCHWANLNGKYVKGTTTEYATAMCWNSWKGYYYGLKSSKMLVRV